MTEKEARIYLTTLELGSAPASTIARHANMKRVTGYAILRDFVTEWIARTVKKGWVLYFHVVDPQALLAQFQSKVDQFDTIIPELLAMADTYGNKPKIKYFEGVEWIKDMYDDLLHSSEGICSFLWYKESHPHVHEYLIDEFLPKRIQAEIHARVILSPSEENRAYVGLDKEALKESILIDEEVFKLPSSEINIYGPNKVMFAMFAGDELSWLIIESKTMYESLKSIFELIWRTHHKA